MASASGAGSTKTSGAGSTKTSTSEAVTAPCAIYEDDMLKIKKDLEKKGEAAIHALYQEKGVNSSSIGSVLGALGNGTITEQSLTNIIQKGFDEFKEQTGRAMSYGEMRELYG